MAEARSGLEAKGWLVAKGMFVYSGRAPLGSRPLFVKPRRRGRRMKLAAKTRRQRRSAVAYGVRVFVPGVSMILLKS
jgi:hypothetical protein